VVVLVKDTRNRYYDEEEENTPSIITHVLNWMIGNFFPPYLYTEIKQESIALLGQELLM
jgi:hypothetical protein